MDSRTRRGHFSAEHGRRRAMGKRGVTIVAVVLATLGALVVPTTVASAAARQPVDNTTLSGRTSKLSPRLQTLLRPQVQALSAADQSHAVGLADTGPGSLMQRSGGRVVVLIRLNDTSTDTLDAVRAAGVSDLSLSTPDAVANGVISPDDFATLVAVPGVASVSEEITPMVASGALARTSGASTSLLGGCPTGIVSEGDTQLKADLARTNFGVNGAGVKVGVLSDSYNGLVGAAGDVTGNELPGTGNTCGFTTPVQVQADSGSGEDEGRAMAQIVHDLAPGSSLAFATAFNGVADFANQIRNLKASGSSVITDDVTYFTEPMFQDGIIAKAVDDVVAGGVTYYSSAANHTLTIGGHDVTSYETGAFRQTPCPTAINTFERGASQCHNFSQSGTDAGDTISVNTNRTALFSLSYSQPQGRVTTDLDLLLVDATTGAIVTSGAHSNLTTEDPSEFLSYTNNTGAARSLRLVVARYEGVGGGDSGLPRFKFVTFPNGDTSVFNSFQYNVSAGNDIVGPTVIGHNGASRAATVAAVPYNDSSSVESYSSHGPVKKCWGPTVGTAPLYQPPATQINPCQTKTVDFAATDGGLNSFFPPGTGPPFRFYGTSAAAPHAAAVGALARSKYPCRTPDEILAAQRSSATPMAYGADVAGSGLVDANRMLQSLLTCGAATVPGPPTGLVAAAGNAMANVSWAAPVSNGGSTITSYTVVASPGGQTCGASGPLTCNVSGLTNGTPYTFTVVAHNSIGDGPPSFASNAVTPSLPSPGTNFHALPAPARILDSRPPPSQVGPFSSPWGGGVTRDITVGGAFGVPLGAAAVVLNVTVTGTTGSSFLTLFPAGQSRPNASNLNWTAGRTIPNAVTVKLGTAGKVSVFNLLGSVDVIVDVAGYYDSTPGDGYTALTPQRIIDSRPPPLQVGPLGSPWGGGVTRDITVGDAAGVVPPGADAVVLNVTVTNTTAASFLTLWPTGQAQPTASSLNWSPGVTIPNAVTVKLGTAGKVSVFNHFGNVDVIVDVAGYYMAGTGKAFHPVSPGRILDSRPPPSQVGLYSTPWGSGAQRDIAVFGFGGVPADAESVVMNTTVTDTTGSSFLTLWPAGQAQPTASSLNWTPGVTIPNAVTVKLGAAGKVSMFNLSGNVDVIADVAGWFG